MKTLKKINVSISTNYSLHTASMEELMRQVHLIQSASSTCLANKSINLSLTIEISKTFAKSTKK